MKRKLLALFTILLMLSFTACKSDDDDGGNDQENVENALTALDQTLANMTLQSSMFYGLQQLPAGLIDDVPFGFPLMPPGFENNSLSKKAFHSYTIRVDSTFTNLLLLFERLKGTHTYNGEEWEFSDTPSDEVIISYPFVDLEDNSQHTIWIRIYGVTVTSASAMVSVQIKVDGTTKFTGTASAAGSNFLNPDVETTITSASVSGTIVDNSGTTYNYSASINNSQMQFSFGPSGGTQLTVTVVAVDLLTNMGGEEDPIITEISITYGNVELVINDFESEEGDVGDVYYSGRQVGDLVIIDGEPYIQFNNGQQVALLELMPNVAGLTSELP